MGSNAEVDKAIALLRDAGYDIGEPGINIEGSVRVPVDGVAKSYDELFEMANNTIVHKAERTGEYVRLLDAPKTGYGQLGGARIAYGRIEYVFNPDPRFNIHDLPLQPMFVSEVEFEVCERPTDAQAEAIRALAKYGSR
jgi:hypothetical protein